MELFKAVFLHELGELITFEFVQQISHTSFFRRFLVATGELHGPDGRVAQILFKFRSGQ